MCGCNSNFDGEQENFSNYDGDFDSENGLLDFDGDVEKWVEHWKDGKKHLFKKIDNGDREH